MHSGEGFDTAHGDYQGSGLYGLFNIGVVV